MAKKSDKPMDSIFDSTNNKKKAASVKAREPGKTAQPAPEPKAFKAEAAPARGGGFTVDRFKVLKTLLKTHEQEAIYRKTKEDRLFVLGLALITAVSVGSFLVRASVDPAHFGGWFYSLLFRVVFAVVTGLIGFTMAAMMELNRTRLQDLLSMIVKIHESFKLFEEGTYADDGGAYLPNTYKFIGSINDDETNYYVLVLKVGSIVAAMSVFLLV